MNTNCTALDYITIYCNPVECNVIPFLCCHFQEITSAGMRMSTVGYCVPPDYNNSCL